MKKKWLSSTIIILLIIAGLSLMLYPTVSDRIKSIRYRRVITEYQKAIEAVDDDTFNEYIEAAKAYNERLARRGVSLAELSQTEIDEYETMLNVAGNGVMGYVVIEKINVALPIYHGTSDEVLQNGVGHLEGSSLPVGGPSTHSILSAHRGLPSAKLFTNIDRLENGDVFALQVMKEILFYEVDQILTVLPHEIDALEIVDGEDYCTLVTCTPYGINSHRLLVRGHRIDVPVDSDGDGIQWEYTSSIETVLLPDEGYVHFQDAIIVGAILVVVLIITIVIKSNSGFGKPAPRQQVKVMPRAGSSQQTRPVQPQRNGGTHEDRAQPPRRESAPRQYPQYDQPTKRDVPQQVRSERPTTNASGQQPQRRLKSRRRRRNGLFDRRGRR